MIQSFNKNQKYLSSCVVYILNIIVHYPQFNNYEDICEIFDIYIRKLVLNNSSYSKELKIDCLDMVKFFFTTEYISQIISSFERTPGFGCEIPKKDFSARTSGVLSIQGRFRSGPSTDGFEIP
jgi:hypothetical protein